MHRVLEPELMDDEAQSVAYAKADFSASNQTFVDGLVRDFPDRLGTIVDLGCGPGDIDIRLARAATGAAITAVDGSRPMIALAERAVRAAGLERQITLLHGILPGLALADHSADVVISKDLLHHLPDPSVLWHEAVRLARRDGAVYVMDLVRPSTPDEARRIVEAVAGKEDAILRQDFFNSLCAAFTVDEIREQLRAADLPFAVAQISDRHMLIKGVL
jgi:ubiquinone/menaquinone biosynthesis C-methylase UbiE